MTRTKSTDPRDRLGVYKRLDDVPPRHRLDQYTDEYEGRNVWAEFCRDYLYDQGSSQTFHQDIDRTGQHWIDHMERCERHHALASPADVETWCRTLVEDDAKSLSTAFNYWSRIKSFYDWLRWHVDHPHVYDPALMAVAEGGAAGEIWGVKLRKWRQARTRQQHDD